MSEAEQRTFSKHSHHNSRSKSRDSDGGSECHVQSRQSKSHSKLSKSKKKKSKKRRFYRSSSSSSSTSKNSSRSPSSTYTRISVSWGTKQPSTEENSSSSMALNKNVQTNVARRTAIESIEADSFTAETFFRTADKKIPEKVIIDLKNETISVERNVDDIQPEQSLIFHPNCLGDDERRMERWIKKLYNYRLKSFQD